MQEPAGEHVIQCYLDGLLLIATYPIENPISNIDQIMLRSSGSDPPVLREFNVRASAVYTAIPFTAGDVSFASSIGDTQKRWNSYML